MDWRGQGRSAVADTGYDMDTLTEDLVALIDHLGIAPVDYVGLSMGGFIGMRLAARHPEVVRALRKEAQHIRTELGDVNAVGSDQRPTGLDHPQERDLESPVESGPLG